MVANGVMRFSVCGSIWTLHTFYFPKEENMKQVVALLLICLSFFMLCACGGNVTQEHKETQSATTEATITAETSEPVLSKEEMLMQAISAENKTIGDDFANNILRAKETYCGHIIKIEGNARITNENVITIRIGTGIIWYIDAYLSSEDMLQLDDGQKIILVGYLDDTITETTSTSGGSTYTYKHLSMSTAYVAQDRFEVSGRVGSKKSNGAFSFFTPPSNHYGTSIWFTGDTDTSKFTGVLTQVRVSAKVIYRGIYSSHDSGYDYKDAIIIG